MGRRTVFMTLVAVLLAAWGCQSGSGGTAAPQSTPELRQSIGSGKKTVVFFLNPNGGPCQAQNEILQKLVLDRGGSFNVTYVSAMQPENQKAFYDYGVRSLPTLVLVDGSGKISRTFPPGIQTYETLAAALDGIK